MCRALEILLKFKRATGLLHCISKYSSTITIWLLGDGAQPRANPDHVACSGTRALSVIAPLVQRPLLIAVHMSRATSSLEIF